MASHKQFSLLLLTSALILVFPIAPSHAFFSANDQKVNLSLYYETLCPYCSNFIVNSLVQIFKTDLYTIVNLRLVPWGNAVIVDPNNTVECQHGPDECYFNTIEACAIKVWPDVNKHFQFIHCIEDALSQGKYKDKDALCKFCSTHSHLSPKPIQDCYKTGDGEKLILQNAAETGRLNPPHTYVPWVVVNNQPLYDDYENYVSHICKVYKGQHPPKACISLSPKINSSEKTNSFHPVCYATEPRNSTLAMELAS